MVLTDPDLYDANLAYRVLYPQDVLCVMVR